jgi:hypothetical protein
VIPGADGYGTWLRKWVGIPFLHLPCPRYEGVKKLGYEEKRSATHVQGPEKFACQNEAVLSLLPVVDWTAVRPEGKSLLV